MSQEASGDSRELVLVRIIDAPPEKCYTARVLHWSAADREAHEKMGFHEGWSKATDQLAELVAGL